MIAPAVPYECDSCPTTCTPTQVPGSPGTDGADGTNGATGANAYTQVTTGFTMPAIGDSVDVEVGDTAWMVPEQGGVGGQVVTVEFAGSLVVEAIIDGTNVTLRNDGYTENAPGGTAIPALAKVGVGGRPGETGVAPGGALLSSNNLSDVADPATSLANLGAGSAATLNIAQVLQSANNLSELASKPVSRANLGVAIGTDVQAYTAFLDGLGALAITANRIPYINNAGNFALNQIFGLALTLFGAADEESAQTVLGVRRRLLGSLIGVDLNPGAVPNDTPIPIIGGAVGIRYRVREIVLESASISLTTATAGVFTGGGSTVAADQALATATGPNKFFQFTLSGVGSTDVLTDSSLIFRIATAQGAAATANIWIFGDDYTP